MVGLSVAYSPVRITDCPSLEARGTGQQLSSPATENQVLLLSSLLGPVKQETK